MKTLFHVPVYHFNSAMYISVSQSYYPQLNSDLFLLLGAIMMQLYLYLKTQTTAICCLSFN